MTLFTLRRCAAFFATLAIAGAGQATQAAPAASHPAFQVDVTGKGAPMILIPGLASSGEVWQGTVARLCGPAQRRQCHVLSLSGFLALKLAIDHQQQAGKLVIVDALPALGAVQRPSITPEQLQGMASKPDDVARITGWGTRSDRNTVIDAMATLSAPTCARTWHASPPRPLLPQRP